MKRKDISKWYAKIGALGGKAGKDTRLRRELNRRAAQIRWANAKNASATAGATKAR